MDLQYSVTRAFMTWTIIEILRHTGIRIEEMLELTHLSIKQYRKPDGTVIPLLGQVQWRGVRRRRVILRGDGSGGQCRGGVLLFVRGVVDGA